MPVYHVWLELEAALTFNSAIAKQVHAACTPASCESLALGSIMLTEVWAAWKLMVWAKH